MATTSSEQQVAYSCTISNGTYTEDYTVFSVSLPTMIFKHL